MAACKNTNYVFILRKEVKEKPVKKKLKNIMRRRPVTVLPVTELPVTVLPVTVLSVTDELVKDKLVVDVYDLDIFNDLDNFTKLSKIVGIINTNLTYHPHVYNIDSSDTHFVVSESAQHFYVYGI